jgi:hypothetical protein
MNSKDVWSAIEKIVADYVTKVREELSVRWENWPLDLSKHEMHEAIGALLARQVTLAVQLAASPGIWNGQIAPLILRSMVDNYINLAWILSDPLERARKFILYGLGQEKLQIEHRKAQLARDGKDVNSDPLVQHREDWLNSQKYSFLTEVTIGSWSGIDTRKMAEEAGCIDLYNYAYTPFSSCTHNMWQHVGQYNLVTCPNPLHRFHQMPIVPDAGTDPGYLCTAAKYVDKAFTLFDEKTAVKVDPPCAYDQLVQALDSLGNNLSRQSA